MGNNQSNERTTNYKVFRISRKEKHSDWFRCYLDDYVSYNNGNEKRIDFQEVSGFQTFRFAVGIIAPASVPVARQPVLEEGNYIKIDMNYTKEHSSGHSFSSDSVEVVGFESVDSDGRVSIFGTVCDITNDILEARQRYAEQASYNSWLAQTESWTSHNLPPR